MDLTKLTLEELKAMVYDELEKAEIANSNIKYLQAEIQSRKQSLPVEDKKDDGRK